LTIPGVALGESDGDIDGVSVDSIWKATNFWNTSYFATELLFVEDGLGYHASTTHGTKKPSTGEPLGLEMTWRIRRIDDGPALDPFTVPPDADFIVVGEFTFRNRTVRTYSVATSGADGVTGAHLGYTDAEGRSTADVTNPASVVFTMLGIQGPHTTTIELDQDGNAVE
jgi:hypothetical protein